MDARAGAVAAVDDPPSAVGCESWGRRSGVTARCGSPPTRIRWHRQRLSRRHAHLRPRRRRTARTSPAASSMASFSPSEGWRALVSSAIAVRASRVKNSRAACRVMPRAAAICSHVAPAARADAIRSRHNRSISASPRASARSASRGAARQRMRDDQVHRTSVTRRACPRAEGPGCGRRLRVDAEPRWRYGRPSWTSCP